MTRTTSHSNIQGYPTPKDNLPLQHTAHPATPWSPTLTPHRDAFLRHLWGGVAQYNVWEIGPDKRKWVIRGGGRTLYTYPSYSSIKSTAWEFWTSICADVFMKVQPFISSSWQERWDEEVDNKLHTIMPQIDEKYYFGCTNRKDEVIINRLRIRV